MCLLIVSMEGEGKRDSIFSANKGDERRSLNKIEIVSIRILERWDEAINTFQLWREAKVSLTSNEERLRNKLQAVLYAIYIMNQELFKRKLKTESFEELKKAATSNSPKAEELEKCFKMMNKTLDEIGLIKIDLERKKRSLEEINKMKGFD
jgi:hypothetical protein